MMHAGTGINLGDLKDVEVVCPGLQAHTFPDEFGFEQRLKPFEQRTVHLFLGLRVHRGDIGRKALRLDFRCQPGGFLE